MLCPHCGTSNADTAKYCIRCGKELAMPAKPLGQPAQYAGFWRRAAATLIDTIPLAIMSWIVGSATHTPSMYWWDVEDASDLRGFLFGALIGWLYFALAESSRTQATLGKMIIGLYVTDDEGRRLSLKRATGRHFGKYLSGAILGIGFLMAGFTEKKQGLHDIMAKTLVLKHTS